MADAGTPLNVKTFQQRALIVAVIFLLLFAVGLFTNPVQFMRSYLFSFTFWIGFPLGCLVLLMLQHLTGGGWGLVIRRPLEAATRTLPLMLILFIPIVLGSGLLYPWTHEPEITHLGDKTKYLNLPFFIIRALVCFGIWILLTFFLNRWSGEQDRTGERQLAKKMRVLSGPGMVLFVLTVTIVSVDWVMSLEPEWMSTMFGLLFVGAWGVTGLAFAIGSLAVLSKFEPLNHIVARMHFHDLGKLLLALVMLWTYFAFSQYLIIWSGNLPEEIRYYLPRVHGVWGVIAVSIALLHFAAPFLFLLSRNVKRDPRKLLLISVLILLMRLVDFFWMITPSFTHEHFVVSWMDVVAPIGIGALWLAAFAWKLTARPLVALNDPQYESVLEQAHAHH